MKFRTINYMVACYEARNEAATSFLLRKQIFVCFLEPQQIRKNNCG